MASLYGKHWLDMWADVPIDAVKEEWQGGLYGFNLTEIGNAINYCAENNKFPPTLPEFRDLCKTLSKAAKQTMHTALPRKMTEEELEESQKRLHEATATITKKSSQDSKHWARKILGSPSSYPDISVKFAHEALGAQQ